MPGLRDLKTRIKSVQSTRKITRAMQMVSAAKMKKAQNLALSNRAYAQMAWTLIQNIVGAGVRPAHPLLASYPKAKKTGVIFLSTNRGMVGSLNTNLFAKLRQLENPETLCEIVTYGRKGNQMLSRMGKNLTADFPKAERQAGVEDVYPIAQMVAKMYASGEYKSIVLLFNRFESTLSQKPEIRQLLPFSETFTSQEEAWDDEEGKRDAEESQYLFEPAPETVLEHLLPRIVESQLYGAILESDASEHSARMVMMKNATEAAGDLIADYTLTYNQLRQNKITTELAEITAGKIALE